MTDSSEGSFVDRLPPPDREAFRSHAFGVMEANQALRDVSALADMETALLEQLDDSELATFFQGAADNCRRNVELWGRVADHFEAMGRIMEEKLR
ncbi:hypothetical protein [Nocardioides ferulae]|uniref:hypothetical protein n=1 Tax=Nocardioides ferulae TaxID=2340821 RepID=UPI000EB12FD0|nr:hypothetical protein [Nocardioides ferulae]